MGAEVIEADSELIEKVRDLMAPPEDGESWLASACRAADASAQLTKMKHEMARVILAQSAEIARLREALMPLASGLGDDDPSWDDMGLAEIELTIGDLRRARAALGLVGHERRVR